MSKTASISMRVEPDVKSDTEDIFGSFGLTLADAINVFLHKSIQVGGMPFELRQPKYNLETESRNTGGKRHYVGQKESQKL